MLVTLAPVPNMLPVFCIVSHSLFTVAQASRPSLPRSVFISIRDFTQKIYHSPRKCTTSSCQLLFFSCLVFLLLIIGTLLEHHEEFELLFIPRKRILPLIVSALTGGLFSFFLFSFDSMIKYFSTFAHFVLFVMLVTIFI